MKNEEKIKDEERSAIKIVVKGTSSSRLCILPGRHVGQVPFILQGICYLKKQFLFLLGAIGGCTIISFCWGSPQYSAAAVYTLQLRKAIFLRRLCGVLAPIPSPSAVESLWGFYHIITTHRNPANEYL